MLRRPCVSLCCTTCTTLHVACTHSFVRFSILGQEPSEAEKIAIISVYLGIEADQWATEVTVEDQKVYLEGDMYKKENFFGGGSGVAKVGTGRYKREKRQAKKAARNPMQMRDD